MAIYCLLNKYIIDIDLILTVSKYTVVLLIKSKQTLTEYKGALINQERH